MFNKTYLKAWIEAHKKRNEIMKKQESQIKRLYTKLASFILNIISKYDKDMSKSQLKDLRNRIIREHKKIEKEIPKIINKNAKTFNISIIKTVSEIYKDSFKYKFEKELKDPLDIAIQKVLSGEIYKDKLSIYERLKKYSSKVNSDIETIITKGIKDGLSSYDIAKEIEKYIDPDKLKPWDWNNVYPGVNKKVDYNAQRLARTTLNHVWQESVKESARRNPLITHIEWRSALIHGRTCQQCRDRHGNRYLIDEVPYDHPMGLCVMIPVVDKSLDEIARELKEKYK